MMHKKIAFLFPGQGSQYVGMGKDFYDAHPEARAVFDKADDLLGCNFSQFIFSGPKEDLTLTKNSQLAIFIVSYAIYKVVRQQFPKLIPAICAGLSLGEYTALAASDKISFDQGLLLVKHRAQFMNDACDTHPGTMSVVLGMEEIVLQQILEEIGSDVRIANLNCPGQIVIAGTKQGLALASDIIKQKGAKRILPLDVSGAFHSPLMKDAQHRLTPYLTNASFMHSSVDLVMNTPGALVHDLAEIKANLIRQVTEPVRWEKGIHAMLESGVDLFVEMGCGKTLASMNKRIGVNPITVSIETMKDMDDLAKEFSTCNC